MTPEVRLLSNLFKVYLHYVNRNRQICLKWDKPVLRNNFLKSDLTLHGNSEETMFLASLSHSFFLDNNVA